MQTLPPECEKTDLYHVLKRDSETTSETLSAAGQKDRLVDRLLRMHKRAERRSEEEMTQKIQLMTIE